MNEIKIKKRKDKDLVFFNEAVEYFDKYNNQDFLNYGEIAHLSADNDRNLLRDLMLIELRNLKNLIINHLDLKLEALSEEEKNVFYEFIKFYSVCPVCGNFNHYHNLKKLFFDDDNTSLKDELIRLMNLKSKKLNNLNLNFGILCCNCFKHHSKNEF